MRVCNRRVYGDAVCRGIAQAAVLARGTHKLVYRKDDQQAAAASDVVPASGRGIGRSEIGRPP